MNLNCFDSVKKFMSIENENYRKQFKKEIDNEIKMEELRVSAYFQF